jgi:hypothetical protein
LPAGFVCEPKIPILIKFAGLGIENAVTFYDHLEYFTDIWYNLEPFGKVCGHLVHFFRFGMFGARKIWQPWFASILVTLHLQRSEVPACFDSSSVAIQQIRDHNFFFNLFARTF